MNKRIVVFDCDDVIVNLKDLLVEAFNKEFGLNMTGEEWNQYNLAKFFNIEMKDVFNIFHKYDILREVKVFDHAIEAIHKIIDMGLEPHCLTARGWHSEAEEITKVYFEENGIPIKNDSIIILPAGQTKGQYLKESGKKAMAFIEDNFDQVKSVADTGLVQNIYLREQTWNTDLSIDGLRGVERAKTALDAVNKFAMNLDNKMSITGFLDSKALSREEREVVRNIRSNAYRPS